MIIVFSAPKETPMPATPPDASRRLRAEWRERFIRRQLDALGELGLSQEALAREEALLRGGFAAGAVFSAAPDTDFA
jgi:hypothetical protein